MSNAPDTNPPAGSLTDAGRYPIDLTGPASHTLVRETGVGGLSIGPPSLGKRADLHVAPDAPIHWNVFDTFATPAGSPWPRGLRYAGEDAGFLDWARDRPIETMRWTAALPHNRTVDASESQIQVLEIVLEDGGARLHLVLPVKGRNPHHHLMLTGDLARFSAEGDLPAQLTLAPKTSRRRTAPACILPNMGVLTAMENLSLRNDPLAQPISLKSLAQFPNLKSLSLEGNFTDLPQLAEMQLLENLELRFIPDLAAMPELDTWPLLDRFIAFNVDEAVGKNLRKAVKARAAVRPWAGYTGVSQLRKPEWWDKEYGRPFSGWNRASAKIANQAYDAALDALAQGQSRADAEAAIKEFSRRFNGMKQIETTEREDIGDAVWQLSQTADAARLGVSEDMAQEWFDAVRDY
ncbi:hypothetical protein GRI97_12695 [Altererythrobacter xixiisoli]|uniref:Uncharacterized protein n=1 Tax=Croceibacterium xixiisoli TaxID=1476466 RepID=A0A6I4TV53_9SPHN|nr:hypothetical protein [Croceibacterium xixiisoli]MXO99844.1 hypothetical protein [Croceibacterium xixiisoli]